ncbi:hypothetical protein QF028_004629 [Neobacillus sp. B4I6]
MFDVTALGEDLIDFTPSGHSEKVEFPVFQPSIRLKGF